MKLLLVGSAGVGNAGDEAMLAAQLSDLREQSVDVELRVVSGDPAATLALHGVQAVGRHDPVAVGKALRWCDGLVLGGGSLLQDASDPRSVTFAAGSALAAGRLGKVVSWYAAGLGPLRRRGSQALAARALRGADYLSVRDPASLAVADELGVIGAELVGDPVLSGVPGLPPVPQRRGGRPRVAVALRSWSDDGWFDQMVTALTVLAAESEIVLVPMHAGVDDEISAAVRRAVCANVGSPIELVEPDGGYLTALSTLQSADVVLGMRLHALVAAAAAHRPIVPVSYDPKVDAFAGQLGVPVAASVPGDLRADRLVDAVRAALSLPDIARKEYAATVTDLARRCRLPARRTLALRPR